MELPALKEKGMQAVAVGTVLQFVGWLGAAFFPIELIRRGFPLLISAGLLIIIVGCMMLAEVKGRPKYFGLLGIFGLVGAGILWFLVPGKPKA